MPKTLVISDAHGNFAALRSILKHAHQYCPTEVWYLGDAVGYGPQPDRVWEKLCNCPIPPGGWLAGNHEWGLFERLPGPMLMQPDPKNSSDEFRIGHFKPLAWSVLKFHREVVLKGKNQMFDHLEGLPVMSSPRPGIYLTHGAFSKDPQACVSRYTSIPALSPMELVEKFDHVASAHPDEVYVAQSMDGTPPRIFATGHTHKPRLWGWNAAKKRWWKSTLTTEQALGDLIREPLFLNPGTAGAFRDGMGCPSYMLIDWENNKLFFHRVRYNVEATRDKMKSIIHYRPLLEENGFLIDTRC